MAANNAVLDGECEACGLPGIVGLTCSECGGRIINFDETKVTPKADDDGRYDEDDLLGSDTEIVSLESLEKEEETEDSYNDEDL